MLEILAAQAPATGSSARLIRANPIDCLLYTSGSDTGTAWKPGERRGSKMVFIGPKMPKAVLLDGLAQCVAGVTPRARVPH